MPQGIRDKFKTCVKSNLLLTLTLIGAIIGFSVGFAIRDLQPTRYALMWIGMPGELYLNIIKMMIVPLITSSIISGTSSLDPKSNGKISMIGMTFIMATNFIGTLLGAILCVLINPGGRGKGASVSKLERVDIQTQDVFADLLRNLLPDNLVSSTFLVTMTKYVTENRVMNVTNVNGTQSEVMERFIKDKYLDRGSSTNMLGLLVISVFFGMATAASGKAGRPFLNFFGSAMEIVLLLLDKLLWATPIGVTSLIIKVVAGSADIEASFTGLGIFIGTFMLGLAIALFILHPLVYFIIFRKNPFRFLYSLTEAMLIVLATSLTAAAMPTSLQKLESPPNNIDRRVTRFIVPLSAAIGRTGSSLFISASSVFITQLESRDQNPATIVLIILLATMMTLAVPSVPSSALVTCIVILSAVGISPEAASLLYAFDWFSDRMRSCVNIYFQGLTSAVTYKLCMSTLQRLPTPSNDITMDIQREDHDETQIQMLNHQKNAMNNKHEMLLD